MVRGANHYRATGANDQGKANGWAGAVSGPGGSGTIAGSNHFNSSTVWSTGPAGSPSASGGSQAGSGANAGSH
ncbi:hypothetical protein DN532_13045 [Burkholderia multivorans]|nr:hypothetical protein DN532_13045 [Burkholderia multivorans]